MEQIMVLQQWFPESGSYMDVAYFKASEEVKQVYHSENGLWRVVDKPLYDDINDFITHS